MAGSAAAPAPKLAERLGGDTLKAGAHISDRSIRKRLNRRLRRVLQSAETSHMSLELFAGSARLARALRSAPAATCPLGLP